MEYRPIDTLKLLENNPRTISEAQFEILKKSIQDNKEYFEARPIILSDRTGQLVIIAGNQRYRAAQALGLTEVPTFLMQGLTEEKEEEINVKDNIHSGLFNFDILANNFELDDLKKWGMDEKMLQLEFDKRIELEPKDDDIPNVPEESTVQLGDLYQLGNHRLLCGDSTKLEDVERLMDGQKADMVFTDPPYGINYHTIKAPEQHAVTNDDAMPDLSLVWFASKSECEKYICIDWRNYPALIQQIKKNGQEPKAVIVWNKAGIEERPRLSHVFMKWGFAHEWIVFMGKQGGERYMFADVLYAKREMPSETHHATAKPISIIIKTFEASSNQEDIVLDLFLGSGSTLIAAEKTGRVCYGMEIDPKYCSVIIKRWELFTGKQVVKL